MVKYPLKFKLKKDPRVRRPFLGDLKGRMSMAPNKVIEPLSRLRLKWTTTAKPASLSRARVKKTTTAKPLSTSTLASQSLRVCSTCMKRLDNLKGSDQCQTTRDSDKADIQEKVSSDVVTTSTSMS